MQNIVRVIISHICFCKNLSYKSPIPLTFIPQKNAEKLYLKNNVKIDIHNMLAYTDDTCGNVCKKGIDKKLPSESSIHCETAIMLLLLHRLVRKTLEKLQKFCFTALCTNL